MKTLRSCLVIVAALSLLCCVLYPALVTVAARAIFPWKSSGSLVVQSGRVRGSALLGQTFRDSAAHPEYFWPRPSAASVDTATGVTVSSGSNLGPSSDALREAVRTRVAALRASGVRGEIPADMVTASGSGLDPHVSVAAAMLQVDRVARARSLSAERVRALVRAHTEAPLSALLGEPGVNVLALNLALDEAR